MRTPLRCRQTALCRSKCSVNEVVCIEKQSKPMWNRVATQRRHVIANAIGRRYSTWQFCSCIGRKGFAHWQGILITTKEESSNFIEFKVYLRSQWSPGSWKKDLWEPFIHHVVGTMSPILLTQIVKGEYFRVWIEGTKGEEHCVDKEKSWLNASFGYSQ